MKTVFSRHSKARPIDRILSPFRDFAKIEASGGIILLATTIIALAWANSPWVERYESLWQMRLTIGLGDASLSKPLIDETVPSAPTSPNA